MICRAYGDNQIKLQDRLRQQSLRRKYWVGGWVGERVGGCVGWRMGGKEGELVRPQDKVNFLAGMKIFRKFPEIRNLENNDINII